SGACVKRRGEGGGHSFPPPFHALDTSAATTRNCLRITQASIERKLRFPSPALHRPRHQGSPAPPLRISWRHVDREDPRSSAVHSPRPLRHPSPIRFRVARHCHRPISPRRLHACRAQFAPLHHPRRHRAPKRCPCVLGSYHFRHGDRRVWTFAR